MKTVSAILLAAGESRRMGEPNKLELDIAGVPLLRHSAETLLAARLREVITVLGFNTGSSRRLLAGLPVTMVENVDYREGQMSSVHQGLMALSDTCDGIMICLADQPLLTVKDIDLLIDTFDRCRDTAILVPTFQGRRGNPIILADEQRQAILGGGRNLGCKRLIERNPDLVTTFEMPNDHVVFDLDTPGDYEVLKDLLSAPRARPMAG